MHFASIACEGLADRISLACHESGPIGPEKNQSSLPLPP
jgi:hypothetical protein